MDSLLCAIRENPLSYLPEVSLKALMHFRNGYSIRCIAEGRPHGWQFDRKEFWKWLVSHFQLRGADSIGDINIVSSFSPNEVDAFYNYFALLDEFLRSSSAPNQPEDSGPKRKSFVEVLRAIRERPEMYLGGPTFFGCYSYLLGDGRAHLDLHLPMDDARNVFDGFKRWVETEKNRALPRPWFKVISFWSMGLDCGYTKNSAFSRFYEWLDEYAETVGQPELFVSPLSGLPRSHLCDEALVDSARTGPARKRLTGGA
jgi:hypothetical protein